MLDNLAELLLRWVSETRFLLDRTSWMGMRTHPARIRQGVERWHAALLQFARDNDWINDADVDTLTYCHTAGNKAYHCGTADVEDCELSILLLASYLRQYLPRHHSGKGITLLANGAVSLADIEQDATGAAYVNMMAGGVSKPLPSAPTEYWVQCVTGLLPAPAPERVTALLHSRSEVLFSSVRRRLKFIATDGVDVGLYDVVESRFFDAGMMTAPDRKAPRLSVSGALNMYLALLPRQEELLDIADPMERTRRLLDLLHAHKPLAIELSSQYLDRQQRRVADALDKDPAEGLRTFLAVQRQIHPVVEAVAEFSLDLDGHIQNLIDIDRGK
jgi:hypothetical protein